MKKLQVSRPDSRIANSNVHRLIPLCNKSIKVES